MTIKVGINGFGRIGRTTFRASLDREDLEVVAINHTAPSLDYLLHAVKYDSTHGLCRHAKHLSISQAGDLIFKGRTIKLTSQRDPTRLDWKSAGAEYIVESTGKMTTSGLASRHLKSGAKKVIISAPSSDAPTIVVGVNRLQYRPSMDVVSNASCTTNCLAPLAKIINNAYGIRTGMLTTVHASTASQPILDTFSKKNRRLGRGVAANIIPTSTGAAKAVALVLPELAGKFTGISVRVPVNNVSMIDLTLTLEKPVATKEALLMPIREAAAGRLANMAGPLSEIISVNDEELVSSDFLGWNQSCIVDSVATTLLDSNTVKVIAWYGNEHAYSLRILDLIRYMHEVDQKGEAVDGESVY